MRSTSSKARSAEQHCADHRSAHRQPGTPTYDQFLVIILNLAARIMRMAADGVSDAMTLRPAQVKPALAMETAFDIHYLTGIGAADKQRSGGDVQRIDRLAA